MREYLIIKYMKYPKSLILIMSFVLLCSSANAEIILPSVHKQAHAKFQQEQVDALLFQAYADSLINQLEIEEEDDPFGNNLDIYADWDDAHVDPTRGKNTYVIPDTLAISLKGWVPPHIGRVTSPYGWRRRRMHRGVDLKLTIGDTIRSAFDGKVRIRKLEGIRKGYGYYLVVRHPNGFETVYGHLSKFLVNKDDEVKAGQPIALGGNTGRSTGPHLHFEFRVAGIAIDPTNIIDFNSEDFRPKNQVYVFRQKKAKLEAEGLGSGDAAYHRVKSGDTLGSIARKYGTSVSRLCKLNGIKSTSLLRIGQRIRYK